MNKKIKSFLKKQSKIIIFLAGLGASGKSTFCYKIYKNLGYKIYYNLDKVRSLKIITTKKYRMFERKKGITLIETHNRLHLFMDLVSYSAIIIFFNLPYDEWRRRVLSKPKKWNLQARNFAVECLKSEEYYYEYINIRKKEIKERLRDKFLYVEIHNKEEENVLKDLILKYERKKMLDE